MSFRLFGITVEVQMFFWVTAVLFGYRYLSTGISYLLVWVAVMFVSILAHELGHAFAIRRHRVEPSIALHGMGGTTTWQAILPLSRPSLIFISFAGPGAGFLCAGLVYALVRLAPGFVDHLPEQAQFALGQLLFVNVWWGLLNLLPVLPFDGGHILEQALGPKRARLTAGISLGVGLAAAGLFLFQRNLFGAMIFGLGAMRSYQRLTATANEAAIEASRRTARPVADGMPAELAASLQSAQHALTQEDYPRALRLAQEILAGETPVPGRAAMAAFEIVAWAQLLQGDPAKAAETLVQARRLGQPDAAVAGAVLLAQGQAKEARRVLEAARAAGDQRKEVAGPLISLLVEQREFARAAAVALDILDSLSDEDVRQMATLAFDGGAFDWSARLHEAMFGRSRLAEDAYASARALARAGQPERALELLRKAVDAGFTDRARAWSDVALEALRGLPPFEAYLPRP